MPYKMEKIEQGIRAASNFIDGFNTKNIEVLMSQISSSCTLEAAGEKDVYYGSERILHYYTTHFSENPQVKIKVKEIHNMGKKIIMECLLGIDDALSCKTPSMIFFEVMYGKIIRISQYIKTRTSSDTITI